ncbi:MAG TPA: PHP domain-containing protein [Bryobacteraceae bacterium]|nr:PHP domain-containing protein [Bryobacteraceae bacterium]
MAIGNAAIADKLLTLAHFLADQKGNAFRVKAWRRAARTIRTLGESFDELVRNDVDLTQYPGIGNGIASAIREIVQTGTLRQLETLRAEATPERAAIAEYPGLDAKLALRIFRKLGIRDVEGLREALESGEIARAVGERGALSVRRALADKTEFLLYEADPIAAAVEAFLLERCGARRVEAAGDFRRRVETISELRFLVETADFPDLCRWMEEFGGGTIPLSVKSREAVFQLPAGLALRLRETKSSEWGSALVAATGSAKHLRQLARRGCRPSRMQAAEEAEVYRACGLNFVEPELREGWGDIDVNPRLVTAAAIRGEMHAHTTASDGRNTIGQMAAEARRRGYEYIGITDHSQSLKIAGGLTEEQLREQIREIDQWNERLDGIQVLKSAEVDIRVDGTLDYPDELLRELDYTVCSIHSRFGLGKQEQTERILRAMDNPYFTILGHATGRLLLKRPGYELDIGRIIHHAAERGCFFEINSSPDRLDLPAEHVRAAAAAGIRIAINTDAHGLRDFALVRYGIDVARRAGLSREQVINTLSFGELGPLLATRKR